MTKEQRDKIFKVLVEDRNRYAIMSIIDFINTYTDEGVFEADVVEQTTWIPVSERMPEEREWMGTKRFGTTISDEVYVTLQTPEGERFTKHLYFQNGRLSQTDQEHMRLWFKGAVPIAWRPLPGPYKPEETPC